jgi:hypothetical protein
LALRRVKIVGRCPNRAGKIAGQAADTAGWPWDGLVVGERGRSGVVNKCEAMLPKLYISNDLILNNLKYAKNILGEAAGCLGGKPGGRAPLPKAERRWWGIFGQDLDPGVVGGRGDGRSRTYPLGPAHDGGGPRGGAQPSDGG